MVTQHGCTCSLQPLVVGQYMQCSPHPGPSQQGGTHLVVNIFHQKNCLWPSALGLILHMCPEETPDNDRIICVGPPQQSPWSRVRVAGAAGAWRHDNISHDTSHVPNITWFTLPWSYHVIPGLRSKDPQLGSAQSAAIFALWLLCCLYFCLLSLLVLVLGTSLLFMLSVSMWEGGGAMFGPALMFYRVFPSIIVPLVDCSVVRKTSYCLSNDQQVKVLPSVAGPLIKQHVKTCQDFKA